MTVGLQCKKSYAYMPSSSAEVLRNDSKKRAAAFCLQYQKDYSRPVRTALRVYRNKISIWKELSLVLDHFFRDRMLLCSPKSVHVKYTTIDNCDKAHINVKAHELKSIHFLLLGVINLDFLLSRVGGEIYLLDLRFWYDLYSSSHWENHQYIFLKRVVVKQVVYIA